MFVPEGWLRVLRKLQPQILSDVKGYFSLKIENEDLGSVAQNVWISPTGAVQIDSAKLFDYVGGSLAYIGTRNALVQFNFYQSVLVGGGVNSSAEIACGVNGVVESDSIMPSSSAFGGEILQVTEFSKVLSPGDTIDVFVRQISEPGGANITIAKGVYHVEIVEGL